ncbi:MAG TPA: PAS domain S-box protein [Candidatus Limnocylindrales bacterium]|jgi:PAS domain S-box-containing protein|nr:PAS domain S-box protein [Candidatus Limnocylindrales bacterium]
MTSFGVVPPWFSYVAGLAAVAIATLIRYAFDPWLHDRGPFATYFPAVAVAVFFGGLPAGLWSIFLSTLAADYLFFSPRHLIGIQGPTQAAELIAFMIGAGIIVGFGEAMHHARNRAAELRKLAEGNEKKAREIIETANEGIWLLDAQARITMVNPRMCEMLGYAPAELIGARKWDFAFPEDLDQVKRLFERRRAGISDQVDVRFRTKQGEEVWTLMAAKALQDEKGEFEGSLDMFTDITMRKRAEERLEQAVSERSDRVREIAREMELFSYSMAHDLRAPLRAMQGLARVVLEDFGFYLPEEGQSHLKGLAAAANRMDRLILDVLQYSHLVRGELPLREVDVKRLIEDVVANFPDLRAARSGIVLEGSFPAVLANHGALTQIVSNLLSNAVKFVAPGIVPLVRIRAETDGTQARFYFKDNGIGIPKKAQPKLFGLFQRLHPTDVYEGTGIGLAIVRKAAERMGGQAGLTSEPGHGSEFWVSLKRSITADQNGQNVEIDGQPAAR